MTASISLNPMATTNGAGLFNVNSAGFTQGDAVDDPAVRFALAGGILSASASTPIWGGVPIAEQIPAAATQPGTDTLGSTIIQANGGASPTLPPSGICVFNQAFGGIVTPQSNVPLFQVGMSVNYYRFGSGARIPLPCDSTVVALDGGAVGTTVYYNYTTGLLTTTQPSGQAAFPVKILKTSTSGNKAVSYSAGAANWVGNVSMALCLI